MSIVSIKPEAIYFYLNAALHTFTLAAHFTYYIRRVSAVISKASRTRAPGQHRAAQARSRVEGSILYSLIL